MSNEIIQQKEPDFSRTGSAEGAKGPRRPALDTSIFTNAPHAPSSSVQTTSTAQNTASTDDSEAPDLTSSQNGKGFLGSEEEAPTVPKKNRGLLYVPSRTSSHKINPSPTSTGLSGATVSDPRESLGGRSKESKESILGRRRNGSAASSKMSITPPGPIAGPASNTTIISAGASKQPRKKGFLSFLCCGVPDSPNTSEPGESTVPANKITKVPSGRPTTAPRPEQPTIQQNNIVVEADAEKDALLQEKNLPKPETKLPEPVPERIEAAASEDNTVQPVAVVNGEPHEEPPVDPRDQPLPELPKEEVDDVQPGISKSAVPAQDLTESKEVKEVPLAPIDVEGDAKMENSESVPAEAEEAPVTRREETTNKQVLPPPPPDPPQTPTANESATAPPEPVQQKQQWLLPPIAPRFQGKKCLVLDLDETLVHSSFKILHQADFTIPVEIEGQYHNVYVIKRPGVDQFMKRVGELYEVVVFTASVSKYGDPLLDQLDIHHVVHHRLFRESCYNHQGNYVKDLSQVGRDLRETIIIDNSPTSYIFHPQHAVPISSWFSDAHDNELLDLIPVLEDLAGSQVRDVSLVLDVAL